MDFRQDLTNWYGNEPEMYTYTVTIVAPVHPGLLGGREGKSGGKGRGEGGVRAYTLYGVHAPVVAVRPFTLSDADHVFGGTQRCEILTDHACGALSSCVGVCS